MYCTFYFFVLYFYWTVFISLHLWVHMYMCILYYFNYYLPNFVTAICLGFIFGFSFLVICFNLTTITNHLWNLHS